MKARLSLCIAFACVGACTCVPAPDNPPALPLAVIDTAAGEIVERWKAPYLTYDVAVDSATGRVWVTVATSEGTRVWELFPDDDPVERHQLPKPAVFFGIGSIALDPIRRRAYVASNPESHLLDLDSGELIAVGFSSHSATFDTAGGVGYASGGLSFNTLDGEPLESTCPQTDALAFSGVRQRLYLARPQNNIIVYDPQNPSCADVIGVAYGLPDFPVLAAWCEMGGIAVSPDGSRLYASCQGFDAPIAVDPVRPELILINLTSGAGLAQTEVIDIAGPHGFEVSPDSSTLYVTEGRCNRIRVYDAKTGEFRYDIPMDGETQGMDLSPDGSRLFVAQAHPRSPLGGGDELYTRPSDNGDIPPPPCPPVITKSETAF